LRIHTFQDVPIIGEQQTASTLTPATVKYSY
jgi:hypothetical protein